MTHTRTGTTLPETLILCALALVVVAGCLPNVNTARTNALKLKDGTQLRNIMQGSQQFAAANRNRYPLPILVDRVNDTEGSPPSAYFSSSSPDVNKNRTGAILSIMIWNHLITPEINVSPGEVGNVRIFDQYQYTNPTGANAPNRATYDPAFNGTPFDNANDAHCLNNVQQRDTASHNSYAHNCVAFARSADWTNTASGAKPVWSNRGPVYADDTRATYDPANTTWSVLTSNDLGDGSNAVLIWGSNGNWEGNVAFADSSVSYLASPQPAPSSFSIDHQGTPTNVADNIFVDEHFENPDASMRRNAYLRAWKRGIPTDLAPADFDYATHLAPSNDANGFAWTD